MSKDSYDVTLHDRDLLIIGHAVQLGYKSEPELLFNDQVARATDYIQHGRWSVGCRICQWIEPVAPRSPQYRMVDGKMVPVNG